tara:strand:+ start:656 stop:874 length:219 start_codon:yes stop_codon:yes gene_type:complete
MEDEEDIEFSQLLDEAAGTEESSAENPLAENPEGELPYEANWGIRICIGVLVFVVLAGMGCLLYLLNPPSMN